MRKPEWKDAPDWAMFLAQDKDGWWSWWNISPLVCERGECWNQGKPMENYKYEDICASLVVRDWKETLEPRP